MDAVKILTDSCADIGREIRDAHGVDYVHMYTEFDGTETPASLDWEYYTPHEFYNTMRAGGRIGIAFRSGVRRAYEAVMKPTEETMLAVMREAADYACSRIHDGSTVEDFFADCLQEMNASLQRTPEYLEVLREAGVIDSGGAGLVYIVDA